jgi:uncharacterized protein
MIAVDTNILVYAHRYDSRHNEAAYRQVNSLVSGRAAWGVPWPCIHEFLAVVTNPRAFADPSSIELALQQVEIWRASPSLMLLGETTEHWSFLGPLLQASKARGGLVHDARIAAICLEHGVRELWTADRDFARFPGLVTHNPLEDDRVHDGSPSWAAAVRARAAGRRRQVARTRAPAK